MGQSLLIDMNSGWYKHKTELNEGLRTRNYSEVEGALDALNALLPDEYRVLIDTELYNERIKGNMVALCGHCTTEYDDPANKEKTIKGQTRIDVEKMERQELLLPSMDRMIYGKETDTFWTCPECNKDNRLSETKFKRSVLQKPFYLKVVPEPPKHKPGIDDRTNFHYKFERWARAFLTELNAQARQFRHDYRGRENEFEDSEAGELYDDEAD